MELIVIPAILILLITAVIVFSLSKNKWVDTRQFAQWKSKISQNCDARTLKEFQDFLTRYKGGYVKRSHGKIIYQDFLGTEKGDLKGIFFHVIVPSRQIPISQKEEFRGFLLRIGVRDVNARPHYEERDGKLRNRAEDEEKKRIKEVGNRGEKIVRKHLDALREAGYFIVSGVVLQYGGETKEFDHIVIGENGIFILETKAFGLSENDEKDDYAKLFINQDGSWILRKHHNSRPLTDPTDQILAQQVFMEQFTSEFMAEAKHILVLANPSLQLIQNKSVDFDIVPVQKLCRYIQNTKGSLPYNDRLTLISKINENRRN